MQVDIDVTANAALITSKRSWLGTNIGHAHRQSYPHALLYDIETEDFLDQIFYHRQSISIQSRHL